MVRRAPTAHGGGLGGCQGPPTRDRHDRPPSHLSTVRYLRHFHDPLHKALHGDLPDALDRDRRHPVHNLPGQRGRRVHDTQRHVRATTCTAGDGAGGGPSWPQGARGGEGRCSARVTPSPPALL